MTNQWDRSCVSAINTVSYAPSAPPVSFQDVLASYSNQAMWEYLLIDGNGEWIHDGLVAGLLIVVHDGSCMPECAKDASGVGFVFILCLDTGQVCKGALAERSDSASN